MKRFWISWWTTELPWNDVIFKWWVSGSKGLGDNGDRAICAIVDADSEEMAWKTVGGYFIVDEKRFCNEKPMGWQPNDRFR